MLATTETLDRLYLEWSQFTKARTAREIEMLAVLRHIADDGMEIGGDECALVARAAIAKVEGESL